MPQTGTAYVLDIRVSYQGFEDTQPYFIADEEVSDSVQLTLGHLALKGSLAIFAQEANILIEEAWAVLVS